jgi:hypothetical protein
MAAIRGRKGKVERFYWREITKTFHSLARSWLLQNDKHVANIIEFRSRFSDAAKALRKQALQYWQGEHRKKPKYDMSEPTVKELHNDVDVPETIVFAQYVQVPRAEQKLGKWRNSSGELVSAELIASEFYRSQGWTTHLCERKLASVLYGTFCFSVVQDEDDPQVRIGYRKSTRGWIDAKRNTELIAIPLPQDFGSTAHFKRRSAEYAPLFSFLRSENLSDVFEEWLGPSESLRDYLWANDDAPVALGRNVLRAVPAASVVGWIEWIAGDFWHRQPGWPDLFLVRDAAYRFAEVKSPHDELSQEQMRWFKWALREAGVPCEVCRVRRSKANTRG